MSDSTFNPFVIQIPLSKGFVAIVDEIDGDVASWSWYASGIKGSTAYAARKPSKSNPNPHTVLHRLILERKVGRALEPNEICDHIDLNPLNNRRENLRVTDKRGNTGNRVAYRTNKTGYKGVQLCKQTNKWKVRVSSIWVGRFDNIKDAARAYNQVASKFYGEFFRPNIIEGDNE